MCVCVHFELSMSRFPLHSEKFTRQKDRALQLELWVCDTDSEVLKENYWLVPCCSNSFGIKQFCITFKKFYYYSMEV